MLNSLLAASAAASHPAIALRLLALIREHNFLPDLASYSHLFASLLNTRDPPDAAILERLLGDLRDSRLQPDAPLFSDLISAFARAALPDVALEFLASAQAIGLTPRSNVVTALISALGIAGRVPEAEALFLEFFLAGEIKPRTRVYNALLKGYVKIGSQGWCSEAAAGGAGRLRLRGRRYMGEGEERWLEKEDEWYLTDRLSP